MSTQTNPLVLFSRDLYNQGKPMLSSDILLFFSQREKYFSLYLPSFYHNSASIKLKFTFECHREQKTFVDFQVRNSFTLAGIGIKSNQSNLSQNLFSVVKVI